MSRSTVVEVARFTLLAACLIHPSLGSAQAPPEERAQALFEAGRVAANEGDYEAAFRHFREAFEHSPRPRLLFNMGNAAERLRRDEEALGLYRRFLEELPDAENRVYVEGRIHALSASTDSSEATSDGEVSGGDVSGGDVSDDDVSDDDVSDDEVDPDTGEDLVSPEGAAGGSTTGWLIFGGGAAVVVAGAVMLGVGAGERAAVDAAEIGSEWSDFEGRSSLAYTLTPVGGVLLGVGLAVAVVGVVVAVSSGDDGESEATLRVGPGGISLAGTFR